MQEQTIKILFRLVLVLAFGAPADLFLSTAAAQDTYVIDSRGLSIYRGDVPVCRTKCWARIIEDAMSTRSLSGPAHPASAPDPAVIRAADRRARNRSAPYESRQIANESATRLLPNRAPPKGAGDALARQPQDGEGTAPEGPTKRQKAILLNAGVVAAVAAYGIGFWDYFQTAPTASSEGWFGRTTGLGGMDKLGHFWSAYSVSHLYSYVYRWWDIDDETANTLGAVSSFGIQTLVELGDSFSGKYGFSYEDAIMNALGAGAGYLMGRYPEMARKIDFRLEYRPAHLSDFATDIATDYEHQRYLIALKLDGFDMFHDSYLSYLELHAGYQARGYEGYSPDSGVDNRHRSFYFGVGFNVSKLIQKYVNFAVFDYVQFPYASVGVTKKID